MEKSNNVKIILDTNFLLTMIRYKIHALAEITGKINVEFYTMSGVIGELEALSKGNRKIKKEVAVAKEILKQNNVRILESRMPKVDNELLEKSNEFVIATNDKELRQKIKNIGGKTIYIKKLAFVEIGEITN